ncbi:hypothetical protein BJY24_002799 [Nocardia transvalensis]|uniref:ORC1/DEAH AAA+ ATPase domain-containing protein n=2 Tax=Nocardia transvalensis TaxID=37333 RepID=A0A7W9PD45_9NOCA|nr:hypothetical protein [Nocardia transvalensis]
MSASENSGYNSMRNHWHANLGPIRTPQLDAVHEELEQTFASNAQDGDKVKDCVAVDAFPGLGKTTTVLAFAKKLHQQQIAQFGPITLEGHERWPVCRVGLSGNTGMLDFNKAMVDFYGHPGRRSGTVADFGRRALDCVLSCHTRLLVIDDMHFLRFREKSGAEISNHFKYLANEFPITLVFVGVGLVRRGLFSEGADYEDAWAAQLGRRTTVVGLDPFTLNNDVQRRQWRQLLLAIEKQLVLADLYPGMLADDLSGYLFARSTGHIGSLMRLIRKGCWRAIRTGAERLDVELLNRVRNDAAADQARRELELALESGHLTTTPKRKAKSKTASRPSVSFNAGTQGASAGLRPT